MFGTFLFVVHHFLGQALIFFFGYAAGARAGDGAILDTVFVDADEEFRG